MLPRQRKGQLARIKPYSKRWRQELMKALVEEFVDFESLTALIRTEAELRTVWEQIHKEFPASINIDYILFEQEYGSPQDKNLTIFLDFMELIEQRRYFGKTLGAIALYVRSENVKLELFRNRHLLGEIGANVQSSYFRRKDNQGWVQLLENYSNYLFKRIYFVPYSPGIVRGVRNIGRKKSDDKMKISDIGQLNSSVLWLSNECNVSFHELQLILPQIADMDLDDFFERKVLGRGDDVVEVEAVMPGNKRVPLQTLARATGVPGERLRQWADAIKSKKQAIFYGPPGTGKTYLAKHMAEFLTGGTDGFVKTVQFHPEYAYQDFMHGIRPDVEERNLSYSESEGVFLSICAEAEKRSGPCVLIIDEINRADLSRVFGELMYLLEYRGEIAHLSNGKEFRIPENVLLIGAMNTADRSIALIDYAMRRRFAFFRLEPDYEVLEKRLNVKGNGLLPKGVVESLRKVNEAIDNPHYQLGPAFFLRDDIAMEIDTVWQTEIEPYLEEYFHDQREKREEFLWAKVKGGMVDRGWDGLKKKWEKEKESIARTSNNETDKKRTSVGSKKAVAKKKPVAKKGTAQRKPAPSTRQREQQLKQQRQQEREQMRQNARRREQQ